MKYVLIFLFFLFGYSGFTQITFDKSYGGTGNDEGLSLVVLPDGYLVCGNSTSFGSGGSQIYLIRTGPGGDTLWTRSYGGDGLYAANSVILTGSGDFVICGTYYDPDLESSDIFLMKTGPDGDTLWTRREFSPLESYGNSIYETEDGFIICGYSTLPFEVTRMLLVKTDSEGNVTWSKNYGDPLTATGTSAVSVTGGDIIACGGIDNEIPWWNRNIYAIRTNSDGDTMWTRQYGGPDYEYAWDIAPGDAGGFIITGYTQGQLTPDGNIVATKISGDGTLEWQHQYGQTGLDMGYAGTTVESGGYIFCGQSAVEGSELQTAILIRADASGDTLWTANYGSYPRNFGHDVVQADDGGFVFCGGTSSPDFSYYDAWLVKTNDEGQVISFIPGEDEASEFSIFPNPSTGIFSIRIPLATQKVTVTNALGKIPVIFEATELKNKEQLRLNLGNESPGIYFVTIQTSARTFSLPVILVPSGK